MFSETERVLQINDALDHQTDFLTGVNIQVLSFQGLLVQFAREIKATVLIRGIRSVSDFEYEINLANINKELEPSIETVFLPTSPNLSMISSSMIKEISKYGGDVSNYVTHNVNEAILNYYK
jgi:pantetheine-phosphate adenylyltransferase